MKTTIKNKWSFVLLFALSFNALAWRPSNDTSETRRALLLSNKASEHLTTVRSDSILDTTGIHYNRESHETTFPGQIHGEIDTATFARNAANAQTYLTGLDCDTFVMWRNDTMFTVARCDSNFPALTPTLHRHSAWTLPDSLKHHVAPLHIPVGKTDSTFKSTSAWIDTVYGDVFFERNFYLGDSTGPAALYMGALGTYADRDMDSTLLYFSTYGGGDAMRGPYMVFGGNESSYSSFLISGGDSGDVIISSDSLKRTVLSGGRLNFRLNSAGGSPNDYLQLAWSDVLKQNFYLFSADSTKGIRIQSAFLKGAQMVLNLHSMEIDADSLISSCDLVRFNVSQFYVGSGTYTEICSVFVKADTIVGLNCLIVDSTLTTVVSETIPDDGLDSLFTVSLPTGGTISGTISYSIIATGTTTLRAIHTGILTFAAVNEDGSITADIDDSVSNGTMVGSGSLSDTWSIVAGTGAVIVRLQANSALTTPTIRVRCHITLHSLNSVSEL